MNTLNKKKKKSWLWIIIKITCPLTGCNPLPHSMNHDWPLVFRGFHIFFQQEQKKLHIQSDQVFLSIDFKKGIFHNIAVQSQSPQIHLWASEAIWMHPQWEGKEIKGHMGDWTCSGRSFLLNQQNLGLHLHEVDAHDKNLMVHASELVYQHGQQVLIFEKGLEAQYVQP